MFAISEAKKNDFWNTLATEWRPKSLTAKRFERAKKYLWNDGDFWDDIVARHGGLQHSCAEIKRDDDFQYEHMLGNFHSWCFQVLREHGERA